MSLRRCLVAALAALLAACAGNGDQTLVHPRATSKILGVRTAQAFDVAARYDYDASRDDAATSEALKPSVVLLRSTFGMGSHGPREVGSGVVVCRTPRHTYLMTAAHVVDKSLAENEYGEPLEHAGPARSITVHFYEDVAPPLRVSSASVVSRDLAEDVALLRLSREQTPSALEPAPLGSSSTVRPGAKLRTIGHAASDITMRWILEFPEVNDLGRRIGYRPAVNTGFSGGPVFDERGRIVGINSFTLWEVEFSQAVPIERAVKAVEEGLDPLCPRLLE
ncbi:MAG: S1 family peptidase [Myxococcota bacterium]